MLHLSVQDEAGKIKKEASDLDKLIDKTEKEYNDLREDLKGKEQEVRKLLEKGKSEQQVSPASIPSDAKLSRRHIRCLTSCFVFTVADGRPAFGPG